MASRSIIKHGGNDLLFLAIELSVLATFYGIPFHVHAEGVRGTGKTTVVRSVRANLPHLTRLKNCMFNCDPEAPHCPDHYGLSEAQLKALDREQIPMPFLEISASAKLGTVVGTIDLDRAARLENPSICLLPGTLPQAHRGIVFVDEINRLADAAPEVADSLLDVMGTKPGRIQIEETGIRKVELPLLVSVWAASNPDEEPGPLESVRKQLADRFDVMVRVLRPSTTDIVHTILASVETPVVAEHPFADLRARIAAAPHPSTVIVPESCRWLIASVYTEFNVESLRAVESLQLAGRLHAALNGRKQVALSDLLAVAPIVFAHRVDPDILPKLISFLEVRLRKEIPAGPVGTLSEESTPCSRESGLNQPESPESVKCSYRSKVGSFRNWLTSLREAVQRRRQAAGMTREAPAPGRTPSLDIQVRSPQSPGRRITEIPPAELILQEGADDAYRS